MNTKQLPFGLVALLALLGATELRGQTTAFTFQGSLTENGAPAHSTNDLTFALYAAAGGGSPVGSPIAVENLVVSNGLFTVTLDFGAGVFTGADRWLEVSVRPGDSTGAYVPLLPRQKVTSTPYAIFAGSAAIGNNTITGNMLADGGITVADLSPGLSNGLWSVSGGDVYRASGLVGIGRVPANGINLDVAGFGRFSGNLTLDDGTSGSRFSVRHDGPSQTLRFRDAWGGVDLMALNKSGSLGIGTTTPAYKLHVQDPGAQTGRIHVGGTGANGDRKVVSFGDGDFVYIGENGADDRMDLKASTFHFDGGNVGIGTTTPGRPLSIKATGGNGEWISFNDTNDVTRWHINHSQSGLDFVQSGVADARLFLSTNGNVGIGDLFPGTKLVVAGEVTCVAINLTSDRNAKEHFKSVNPREVLAKVAAMPISEWQYKGEQAADKPVARHIGPMAQDFHAAFATGRDDKHITTVDADGVALAAIQGLNQKVDEKDVRIRELEREMAELKTLLNHVAGQLNGGAR